MLTRLLSMNPLGPVLLLLALGLLLASGRLPERRRLPARLVALALAFVGAIFCFV